MIKLRHQQPSLWHRGLAEDIEGCGNLGCGGWTNYWKTSSLWTRCTKRKGTPSAEPQPWPNANACASLPLS
jgi:hypothetical protein